MESKQAESAVQQAASIGQGSFFLITPITPLFFKKKLLNCEHSIFTFFSFRLGLAKLTTKGLFSCKISLKRYIQLWLDLLERVFYARDMTFSCPHLC